MSPEEITTILHVPFSKLVEQGKDPSGLLAILSLAINKGINMGQNQTHESYHIMMTGYNEAAITTWRGIRGSEA